MKFIIQLFIIQTANVQLTSTKKKKKRKQKNSALWLRFREILGRREELWKSKIQELGQELTVEKKKATQEAVRKYVPKKAWQSWEGLYFQQDFGWSSKVMLSTYTSPGFRSHLSDESTPSNINERWFLNYWFLLFCITKLSLRQEKWKGQVHACLERKVEWFKKF